MAQDPTQFLADLWNTLMANPIYLIGIVIAFGILYFIYLQAKKGKAEFKEIPLREFVVSDMENVQALSGTPQFNKRLRIGAMQIGKIKEISLIFYQDSEQLEDKTKKGKLEPVKLTEFYLFKIYDSYGIIDEIKEATINRIFKDYKYCLVDKDAVEIGSTDCVIAEKTAFVPYGGVYVFSGVAREYIRTIIFKKIDEQKLEGLANFLKKMTYLEVKQASRIEKYDKLTELEKSKWDKRTTDIVRDAEQGD